MTTRLPRALALPLVACLLAACDGDRAAAPAGTAQPVVPAPGPGLPAARPGVSPATVEALALLVELDEQQVRLAEQAKARHVVGGVLAFANAMDAEHGKHLPRTRSLLEATGSSAAGSAALLAARADGRAALDRLAALDDADYPQAYVARAVEDHLLAIERIDAALAGVSDRALAEHLAATRRQLREHLERARGLQDAAGGAIGSTGKMPGETR